MLSVCKERQDLVHVCMFGSYQHEKLRHTSKKKNKIKLKIKSLSNNKNENTGRLRLISVRGYNGKWGTNDKRIQRKMRYEFSTVIIWRCDTLSWQVWNNTQFFNILLKENWYIILGNWGEIFPCIYLRTHIEGLLYAKQCPRQWMNVILMVDNSLWPIILHSIKT